MIKILHLTDCFEPIRGGQEVYIQELVKICDKEGFESRIIQPYWASASTNSHRLFFTPRIPKAHKIPGFHTLFMNLMTRLLYWKHLGWADVIICHYASKAIFLKKYWHKVVILSHGVEWNTKARSYWDKILYENAKALMQKGLQHVVNDTNYLRVLGQKIKHGQGFFLKIRPNVTFIPNCVDIKFFTPPVGQREQNKILVSRNFRWDRGVDLAVQAFLLIKDKYPKVDLVLAGQTFPGPYLESIKKIIKKNKIHQRVVLFGHANRKELKRLYAASLISLVPTRDKEGTSLSALESMAMGTPCVSTRIGGLNDLPTIKCDVSSKDLSKAIIRTLKKHKNIGESQQRLVRQIFNLSNWRTAWVGVIRQKALSQTI